MRAVRGAIQVPSDTPEALRVSVPRLLEEMLRVNVLSFEDVVSILFTSTPDLVSDFPAAAARTLPVGEIPLICAAEIQVPGALERIVRVMMYVETTKLRSQMKHVYLDGAEVLRRDLAQ
jgi:chorismate mutase